MQKEQNSKIWQTPWGYPESFAIIGGIVSIGLLLQVAVGSFDFYLLTKPINIFVAVAFTMLSVVLGLSCGKSSFARWFSGVHISVALTIAMVALTIIMGLTPQRVEAHSLLGFESMTTCWAFILVYVLVVISLGSVIVRRARHLKMSDIPFYINHLGLWIVLMASGLGCADMQRYIMYVNEGETEWRVYDADQNIQELPIAITLNDFSMDFYPSKQVIVDVTNGKVQHGDQSKYELGDRYRAVMSVPEPKSFRSDIEVYTEDGEHVAKVIKVNKPLRLDSWVIYQYGYDNAAGNRSSYSSFELVYDAWILPVYIGVIMMMIGSVTMLWSGRNNKEMEVGHDME